MIDYILTVFLVPTLIVGISTYHILKNLSEKTRFIFRNPFMFAIPTFTLSCLSEAIFYGTIGIKPLIIIMGFFILFAFLYHTIREKKWEAKIKQREIDLKIFLIGLPHHDWSSPCSDNSWEEPYAQHLLSYLRKENMCAEEFIQKYKYFRDIQEVRACLWLLEIKIIHA